MARFTPVLTSQSLVPIRTAKNATEGTPEVQLPVTSDLQERVYEAAFKLIEVLPEFRWVIETDQKGVIRITVRL